jgi:hypothetical protein
MKTKKALFILDELSELGECVPALEQLVGLYPDHHIFAIKHDQGRVTPRLEWSRIYSTFLKQFSGRLSRYAFLVPGALKGLGQQVPLDDYDLFIVLSAGMAHWVPLPEEKEKIYYFLQSRPKSGSAWWKKPFEQYLEVKERGWKPPNHSKIFYSSDFLAKEKSLRGEKLPHFYAPLSCQFDVSNQKRDQVLVVYRDLSSEVTEFCEKTLEAGLRVFAFNPEQPSHSIHLEKGHIFVFGEQDHHKVQKELMKDVRLLVDFGEFENPQWVYAALMHEVQVWLLDSVLNRELFPKGTDFFRQAHQIDLARNTDDSVKAENRKVALKNNARLFKNRFKFAMMQKH